VTFTVKMEAGYFSKIFVTRLCNSESNCMNFDHHENINYHLFINLFSACDCSEQGSLSNVCDVEAGQCSCKSNYGGRTCDICGNGYYNYPQCLCKLT
jgi:hypothetical protein